MRVKPFDDTFGAILESETEANLSELDRDEVIRCFKESGLLLFRGFNASADDFEAFSNRFSEDFMDYKGGGYHRKIINAAGDQSILSVNYYIGSEKQSTFALPLHGEMYYLNERPVVMWFYCVRPALKDGETTVCDGAALYQGLSAATKQFFAAQRLKYIRYYDPADWQKRFLTDDLHGVEEFCRRNGQTCQVDYEKGTLLTEYLYPATVTHRWTGKTIFINNILPVVWQERNGKETNIVRMEDGTKVPDDVVAEIDEVSRVLTRNISWKSGEVAMLDNAWVLHGRRRFDDDQRELYSRMVKSVAW